LNELATTLELKTLFGTSCPVGAGIGSVTSVGSIPLVALVGEEAEDAAEVPTALVAVAVNV
jgi:hypothetical protein